ncbi:MAG TPA: hypothetical protein VL463_34495 [Kofleriaceae bacterium]|nr:hypothetical protein [Kofleriaceae bacterium]
MRIAILILLLSSTAIAGPDVRPELVCKGTVALVEATGHDGGVSQLVIRHEPKIDAYGRYDSCGDQRFHPEGCMISHARITAKGELRTGHLYLATLEPTGGAECSTTATATHWFRLW